MGLQLPKRLDRLGVNKSQDKLRSNMRERLSVIRSVKTADTVTAKYRLARKDERRAPRSLSVRIVENGAALDWLPPFEEADAVVGHGIHRRRPSQPG